MRLRARRGLATLAALLTFGSAEATSLPETYPMPDAEPKPHPVDPALQAWLDDHVERPLATTLDDLAFKRLVENQEPVTRLFLELARANRMKAHAQAVATVAQAVEHLSDPVATKKAETFTHPLLPALYDEMLKAPGAPQAARELALQGLSRHGAGSCASKDVLLADITKERLQAATDQALLEILDRVDQFRSPSFRRTSFRRYIGALPDARRQVAGERLVSLLAEREPNLLLQADWLRAIARSQLDKDVQAKKPTPRRSPFVEPYATFASVKDQAGKKQCSKAKTDLIAAVQGTKDVDSLDDAMAAARAVDSCYRGRDAKQRRPFWDAMLAPMQKTYGFDGWAEVKLRTGYIYWVVDDFEAAKPLFDEVRTAAAREKRPALEARAIYSLGRVAEDEGEKERAVQWFRDYVSRFDNQDNGEDALQALVLLHSDKREWAQANAALDKYITAQSVLPVDDRSVSGMAFALFWAGRIKAEQGDLPRAAELWRRVASEYYSTYYGAIGHYMLEKLTGRILALQPARAPGFRMAALRQSFSEVDRQRVRRVELLMRFGMREAAACELDELVTDDKIPEKILVKALMLHAAGQWLDAIRAYDSLPRSFRYGLPIGFERLIFPQRYADLIYAYSEKAGVDPDLVKAIIRQESVFNPQARSPVGALGLMQLMPNTAKGEAKKLSADYVSVEQKKTLNLHAQNPATLTLAESNLAIGIHHVKSLLSRYPSPVYVLAAYNASPSAAQRWMTTIPTGDILSFIEKIPYKETRAYVKLVLRNYFYYKRWYGPPTRELRHLDQVTSTLVASVKPLDVGTEGQPNH